MPAVPTPAQGGPPAHVHPLRPQPIAAAEGAEPLARAAVVSLLDEAATRATLAAHGEVVVVVAQAPWLGRVLAAARESVETFVAETAVTEAGRRVAAMARAELREAVDAWVMFFARPTRGDDRARTLGVATTVAALRMSARWCGLTARAFAGAPIVTSRVAELIAGQSGSWFAGAELVAAVALSSTGVSATIPPAAALPSSFTVPTLWLGDGDRIDLAGDESERRAGEIPAALRPVGECRVVVCDPSHHRGELLCSLRAAGYRAETVDAAGLVQACERLAPSLVFVQVDDGAVRDALRGLSGRHDAGTVPVLACSACGHEDARLRAAETGALGFLHLPARPFDVARKAHELVAMKQLVDAARRQTAELGHVQAELMRSERLATLGLLAASVGHDLRAPLAAMRSNCELALKALARATGAEAAQEPTLRRTLGALEQLERTNQQAVDRMAEIVAGLKDYARPDDAAPRRVCVREAAEQVLALCAAEVRGIAVRCEVAPDLPDVALRHAELMQVLMNLLLNAAQAAGPGGAVEITARLDGPAVALEVADNGPGVPPEVQAQLFRPGITTRGASGGTGLGLSIVKRIVDGAGGSIELRSAKGAGARFRVLLPTA